MSSEFGKNVKLSLFGESHGSAVGVVIDGLPAGEKIDFNELYSFMDRRRGGTGPYSTARAEADVPEFLSGVLNGYTAGTPLCAIIHNNDIHSADYADISDTPRPSHADYTAYMKWHGSADMRGGGHFSGRLTAPLCIAGGIVKQILARRGIYTGAHLFAVAGINDDPFPLYPDSELFASIASKELPFINNASSEAIKKKIIQAAAESDSVGGIVECAITGIDAGYGSPMFDGIENRLAAALFGIPAIKGVEFGSGFNCANMRGSEHNDPFIIRNGKIVTETNNNGGIIGGITNGMPIIFRTAIKPTPSIAATQRTVSLSRMENTTVTVQGRHDPCIAHRAVPVVEAVAAIVTLDIILENN